MKIFKKTLCIILVVITLLFCVSCDETCKHEYVWTIIKNSTCKESGIESGTCRLCSETTTKSIPKQTEHQFVWSQTLEPTCIKTGLSTGVCIVCGRESTREVDFAEHDYEWVVTKDSASCIQEGEETGTCRVCADKKTRTFFKHNYSWTTIKKPTCTELGEESGICSGCLDKNYRAIELIPHDYDGLFCQECYKPNSEYLVPNNFNGGITNDKIFQLLSERGFDESVLTKVSINSMGMVNDGSVMIDFSYRGLSFNFDFNEMKAIYPIQDNPNVIQTVTIEANALNVYVIYTDRTRVFIGSLKEKALINRLFVNQDNQLIAVYSNNIALNLGTLVKGQKPVSNLVFEKISGKEEYSVVGTTIVNIVDKEVVIPATFNGLPVTEIGKNAFAGCTDIESIILGTNVRVIGNWAFWKCSNLTKLYLPNENIQIRDGAFYKTNLQNIYFEGSIEERNNKIICNSENEYNKLLFKDIWNYNYNFTR